MGHGGGWREERVESLTGTGGAFGFLGACLTVGGVELLGGAVSLLGVPFAGSWNDK